MFASLAKTMLLAAAILAAAPPGACCWGSMPAATVKLGACCQKEKSPAKQGPIAPAAPKANCCCQQPVTEQSKVAVERSDLSVSASLPQASFQVRPQIHFARSIYAPLENGGPPLNLLHCVWRC